MLPRAEVRHSSPGRLRLVISEKRRDREYFERLGRELRSLPGVRAVEGNPVTASVRILHYRGTAGPEDIRREAEERELFTLRAPNGRVRPLTEKMRTPFERFNDLLVNGTSGEVDLRGMAVVTLLGLTAFQVLRGRRFLPAGGSLVWYAVGILQKKGD